MNEPHIRETFVHMPTEEEMRENMRAVERKYHLPNVIAGTDGSHFSFFGQPRYHIIASQVNQSQQLGLRLSILTGE